MIIVPIHIYWEGEGKASRRVSSRGKLINTSGVYTRTLPRSRHFLIPAGEAYGEFGSKSFPAVSETGGLCTKMPPRGGLFEQ